MIKVTKGKNVSRPKSSWENVAGKYHKLMGEAGGYYHQQLIIPKSLALLELTKDSRVLEFACGQGAFARALPKELFYTGIDLAPTLINFAEKLNKNRYFNFKVGDITKLLPLTDQYYSHCLIILALQNIKDTALVIKNAAKFLEPGGRFLIVLNHPMFRIPRQSGWRIDHKNKIQYRYLNRYYSDMEIPINMTPGGKKAELTWSFHHPLAYYSELLRKNGFLIEKIAEWISDKSSKGKAAQMENRARSEIPLFMALLSVKSEN